VTEKAKTLAGELADALACFIPSVENDPPGQDATDNPAAEFFVDGLVRALKLKANLVLRHKRYKLVSFVSGDKFDPEAMVRDTDTSSNFLPKRKRSRMGLPKLHEANNEAPVRLCLFPALYSKKEEEPDRGEGLAVGLTDCLANCANFVVGDADTIDGSYKIVVKAVVIL
jgi:hypothetical protein